MKDFWDKLNWVSVMSVAAAILMQLGNGSMTLAHQLPAAWLVGVQEATGNLGSILALIVSAGAYGRVPKPDAPSSIPTTIIKILIMAFVLSLLFPAPSAMAQQMPRTTIKIQAPTVTDPVTGDKKCLLPLDPLKLCGDLTGKPEEDMQRIVKRIQGVGRDDMNYAILKATTANTNGSKVRLQCLQAILAAKDAAEGTAIKDASGNVVPRPDPAIVTVIEDTAELVDALGPQGPLWTSCAGAAQLFKTNVLQVVNAFVTGAAGIAALPAGL